MSVVQSSYQEAPEIGYEGQPITVSTEDVDTGINKGAAAIPFGRVVGKSQAASPAPKDVQLGGPKFRGIAIIDKRHPAAQSDTYATNAVLPVKYRGDILVRPALAVDDGDPVSYFANTGQLTTGTTASGGQTPRVITGAIYKSKAGAGELARVRLSGWQES